MTDNNKYDPGDTIEPLDEWPEDNTDDGLSMEFPSDHDAPEFPESEPHTTENGTVLPEPIPDDTDPAVVPSRVTAIIRTFTPMLVGWVVSVVVWALTPLGVSVPPSFSTWLEGALPVVLAALYYLLAKWLEHVAPSIPWLGSTRRPLYTPPAVAGNTYALATLARTGYVWHKGGKFSPEFRDALVELDRLTPDVPLVVTQGGFNGTAVSASAGTHAGDAVDFSVRGLTREQVAKAIEAGRKVGIFLSFRTTKTGKWGVRAHGFGSYHLHGVPNGWGAPSAGARRQIAYTDSRGVKRGYRNGRDGLASNGPDVGPGHVGTYRTRTWAGYKAAKASAGAGSWDGKSFPGVGAFVLGKSHPAVTVLGKRLQAHGFGRFYRVGPGPVFGQADKDATRAFQLSKTALKGDADGYPGPATWAALMAAPPVVTNTLKVGSRGAAVSNLQRGLNRVFPRYSRLKVDGIYGTATASVVKTFQRKAGLKVDGVVGPVTRAKLASMGVKF